MRRLLVATAVTLAVGAVPAVVPSVAAADAAICHNGVLSDDAGQGCSDGLYAQVYGSGGGSSGNTSDICHNGILSDDAGQGCADGLYEQVYGSGGSSTGATSTASSDICHDGILSNDVGQGCAGSAPTSSSSPSTSGGSSNSMVNPSCEASNPQQVSANGTYWGKYQFDYQTWVAHGGSPGSYGSASEAEQDQVASRVTYDAWPNC